MVRHLKRTQNNVDSYFSFYRGITQLLSLIHISEPTRLLPLPKLTNGEIGKLTGFWHQYLIVRVYLRQPFGNIVQWLEQSAVNR